MSSFPESPTSQKILDFKESEGDVVIILRKQMQARYKLIGIQTIALLLLFMIGYAHVINRFIFILSVLISIFMFKYSISTINPLKKKGVSHYSLPRFFKKASSLLRFSFLCPVAYVAGSIGIASPFTAVVVTCSLVITLSICVTILYSTPSHIPSSANPFPFPHVFVYLCSH